MWAGASGMAPVLAPPNRFVSELAGDQGTTSEVAMTQQTLAGLAVDRLIAVIGAELPAGFGVAAGRSVVAVGNPVPVRPAAVVAARSALDRPALTPGAAGTALEIGRRRDRINKGPSGSAGADRPMPIGTTAGAPLIASVTSERIAMTWPFAWT